MGAGTLDGRVTQVDAMYMQKPDMRWDLILLKLVVYAAIVWYFGLAVLIPIVALWLLLWIISLVMPRGLMTGVAVQVLSFMLTRKIMGPNANIPVRDLRLRDSNGVEHLVRMKGHLKTGSVTVGDDISLQGVSKNGTFYCRRGFNKRINSAIELSQK